MIDQVPSAADSRIERCVEYVPGIVQPVGLFILGLSPIGFFGSFLGLLLLLLLLRRMLGLLRRDLALLRRGCALLLGGRALLRGSLTLLGCCLALLCRRLGL